VPGVKAYFVEFAVTLTVGALLAPAEKPLTAEIPGAFEFAGAWVTCEEVAEVLNTVVVPPLAFVPPTRTAIYFLASDEVTTKVDLVDPEIAVQLEVGLVRAETVAVHTYH
jgi:hypothetical protein